MLQINNLKLSLENLPEQEISRLKAKAAKLLRLPPENLASLSIVKKSVDARDKDKVCLVYAVRLQLSPAQESRILSKNIKDIVRVPSSGEENSLRSHSGEKAINHPSRTGLPRPVVVGSGPAGMFAALTLAEAGLQPIVLERGAEVSRRILDVETFWQKGILDPESNVQFGEGGAGTFSDGKLTTGIKDSRCQRILQVFTEAGAPPEILYQAKPHIGTDQLRGAVQQIRMRILALGGEYRFGHKMTGILMDAGEIKGILVQKTACVQGEDQGDGESETYEIPLRQLILAVGHSARDTFAMLEQAGIPMEAKVFFQSG